MSIQEWHKMTHDIMLLQMDIEDQIMLGKQYHLEHESREPHIEKEKKEEESNNT